MCVKIIKDDLEITYEPNKSFEEQIDGSTKIIVTYRPKDSSVDRFVEELKKFSKTGFKENLDIKVIHNNQFLGYKAKKNIESAINDIKVNEVIKKIVLFQNEADKKLEEIAKECNGIGCDERHEKA